MGNFCASGLFQYQQDTDVNIRAIEERCCAFISDSFGCLVRTGVAYGWIVTFLLNFPLNQMICTTVNIFTVSILSIFLLCTSKNDLVV